MPLQSSFRILCILFFLSILETRAQFDEAECLQCVDVASSYEDGSFTNQNSTRVYCQTSEDTYVCQDFSRKCEGDTFLFSLDCTGEIDDLIGLGKTIATIVAILSCCCCAAIIGGIAACVYCCVRGSGPPPPGVPGAYQTNPQQAAVVLPGVVNTTTPAQTGLATAVVPNQASVPFAEAVSMENTK